MHVMYKRLRRSDDSQLTGETMQIKFFDLEKQNRAVKDDILTEMQDVIDSNHFILGPQVSNLEGKVANYCHTNHAVALSSGTDALLVALMALDLKPGDEVITTPFTFFATVGSIVRAGATPVFADIDPVTFNISPEEIARNITDKTKCIMPVHLYGQCADMDAINAIAKEHDLKVIEDAAQAIGAKYDGKPAGSMSDIGCFSFFPTKNLGGFGEGGMAVCDTDELHKKMVMLRNHGSARRYYHEFVGGNFRMHALQAASLRVKLKRLDKYICMRRANATIYNKMLGDVAEVTIPVECENQFHTYNQYVIKIEKRDELKDFLAENGVGSMIYYPVCLHEQSCFEYLGKKRGDFALAESVSNECLALPIYPELTDEEIEYVAEKIIEFCKEN